MDYEKFFDMMGNEIRRLILKSLSNGPMSIYELIDNLRLSGSTYSRQALLKQIETLEKSGLIEISDDAIEPKKKGRVRKIYNLKEYYVMQFELNSGGFIPRIIIKSSEEISDGLDIEKLFGIERKTRLKSLFEELNSVQGELDKLARLHIETFQKKNILVQHIRELIEEGIDESEEKELLYFLLKDPIKAINGLDHQEIVDSVGIRKDFIDPILSNLISIGILKKKQDGKYCLV